MLLNEIYQIESEAFDDDPFTYLGVIVDNDANHWKITMELWVLYIPMGYGPWLKNHKARFVAKGYNQ